MKLATEIPFFDFIFSSLLVSTIHRKIIIITEHRENMETNDDRKANI